LIDTLRDEMGPHTVLNPAVPYWNWIALGFGWRSDNRRSSPTFRGIAEETGDNRFEGGLGRERVGLGLWLESKWL